MFDNIREDITLWKKQHTGANRITDDDIISIKGRYLVRKDGSRFIMKGIGFPIPPPENEINLKGWKAVLDQLYYESKGNINTIRLYDLNCREDYSEFFEYAQNLGMYILLPMTNKQGGGVMDRHLPAPRCYPAALLEYGSSCISKYSKYPNVIGGVIGNEVMNTLESWYAAPCLLAYAHDLKLYNKRIESRGGRGLPLLYASQDDAIGGAAIPRSDAMKLMYDYLTCHKDYSIDIFGINVESWCSSIATFEHNEDGTEGTYHELWRSLNNTSIPMVFSEMGCAKEFFNRDNGLTRYQRDWTDVPVVLNDMADTFSGFVAYAYDGNPEFDMMKGGPWDGVHTLKPDLDFLNFVNQLKTSERNVAFPLVETYENEKQVDKPEVCDHVLKQLAPLVKDMYPIEEMPSWDFGLFGPTNLNSLIGEPLLTTFEFSNTGINIPVVSCVSLLAVGLFAFVFSYLHKGSVKKSEAKMKNTSLKTKETGHKYGSINV